jgi:hypothetical protein
MEAKASPRPIWPSIVVGAAGVATVAASIGVGIGAENEASHLRDTCAPHCAASAVDDANNRLLVSDVLLGVGIAAAGVATVLFLSRHGSHEAPPVALHVTLTGASVAF